MDFIARNQVEKAFNDKLALMFKDKPDIYKWITKHERKKLCLENLCRAITHVENNSTVMLKGKHLDELGEQYAYMFAQAALKHEEEQTMHYLAKKRLMDEQEILNEILADETDSTRVLK